ncbi:MAG: PIG-L family deacetylase [Methanomassiliicoccales archaeon]|nr:PIG-L family deacetylase [Methanomassiliicoccales archaeon]
MKRESSMQMSATEAAEYTKTYSAEKGMFQFPRVIPHDFSPDFNALVLSPHPDDDVFGCGGTVCKFGKKGMHFKVVYMTDGRYGSNSIPMDKLIDIRKKEAVNGLRVLGCTDTVFLDNPDLGLRCDGKTVKTLESIFRDYEPKAVFLPPFEDFHPDHVTTSRLAARVLRDYSNDIECYFYEVMAPIIPNTLVDITEVMDLKTRAMRQHKSQIDVVDYAEKIKGLNSYRSIFTEKHIKYCEAFHRCSREAFISIAESLGVLM